MRRAPTIARAQETNSGALFVLACVALVLCACAGKQIPEGESAVESVDIQGKPNDIDENLESGLATKESRTFLGLEGVYEYETYDEAELQKDIERIERQMERRGYYEARVDAARVIRTDENKVRVEISIDAGKPIEIRSLKTKGLAQLPFEAAEAAANQIRLREGDIFDEDDFEQAKQDVANSLSNSGYAFARVNGTAKVDLAAHSAHVEIVANPGKKATLGEITIEGLEKIDERPVRRALKLNEGAVYSRAELADARAALFSLGVFSSVDIVPDLSNPESTAVPITVRISESTLRDVRLGIGGRLDLLRLAVVGQAGWTHKNFLGGLRELSITTRPGVTFFPTNLSDVQNLHEPTALFPENFLTLRLEQPGFVEGRTRGYTQAGYNIYPLLYPLPEDLDPREERVIGYHEFTVAFGVERSWGGRLFSSDLSLNWQANYPIAYQGSVSAVPGLDRVVVAYPELVNKLDLRDDPIETTKGFYIENSLQTALPVLSGSVTDIRIKPEIAGFVPLDQKHKVVLAARFGAGMVFPQEGYGKALRDAEEGDASQLPDYGSEQVTRDQHRLLFRAFYSGGPNSNRGYPYQRIGPQGPIGFLLPPGETCLPEDPNAQFDLNDLSAVCARPLGGLTLWEASAEIRYRAFKSWSFVAFIDSSDVSGKVMDFSLQEPHVSIGPGVRYLSPVGPIRLDLGWRVPGLQRIPETQGRPQDVSEVRPYVNQSWYESFALHILIGEAF